jgi:membrane fusion protein (multidrug efflux system)
VSENGKPTSSRSSHQETEHQHQPGKSAHSHRPHAAREGESTPARHGGDGKGHDDRSEGASATEKTASEDDRGQGDDGKKKRSGPPWYKRPLVAGAVILGVIVVAVAGTLWWLNSRHYETTDDAIVDVVPQVASAQLPGRILRVAVQNNQEVVAGTVLVELDPADFEARAEQARAMGAQAQAQGDQARAQQGIYEAQREQARASLTVAETNANNAAQDRARFDALRQENAGAVSQQQWDKVDAAQRATAAQVEAARKALTAADAQIGYAGSLVKAAEAAQANAAAQLHEAELNISYMQVQAKISGRIANLSVAPGNYVQPGMALMSVVPREVYVTANFKETQLAHMRRGQSVTVHVDAYPDLDLTGHVDSFQPGTGQTFSSLPAENATGNWVKVIQRVPVKITFDRLPDDADRLLGPGMSVEVKVTVR